MGKVIMINHLTLDGVVQAPGPAELTQSLTDAELVDRYVIMVHPVLVGPGLRLFPASGTYRRLALVDSTMTTTAATVGIYEPAEPAA
jgi:dihydrofolate reductase